MNFLPTIQHQGTIAWDGTASFASDLSTHVNFGYSFQVATDVTTDALFKWQSAPPSGADKCVPGTFTDVLEVARCVVPAVGGLSQVTIPAGTKAGTICAGAIPCKPDKFLKLVAVSGDTAKVRIVLVKQGPQFGIARKANPYL